MFKSNKKVLLLLLSALYAILFSIEFFSDTLFSEFPISLTIVHKGSFILLCLLFFWDLFKNSDELNIVRLPSFWIASGILIYNSATFFTYLFSNFIIFNEDSDNFDMWTINLVLNLVNYLFMITALLIQPKIPESDSIEVNVIKAK